MRLCRRLVVHASRRIMGQMPMFASLRCFKLAVPAHFGSPAALLSCAGPVVLRPRLSAGLPLSASVGLHIAVKPVNDKFLEVRRGKYLILLNFT